MKTKTPLKIKLISICALILFALNLAFFGCLRKTEISWIYFFVLSLFFAIPLYVVVYINLKVPQKTLDKIKKDLPYVKNPGISVKRRLIGSFSLGYFIYILLFWTVYFGANYHFSKGDLKHFVTERFGHHREDMYSSDEVGNTGVVQSTLTKIMFFHNGIWLTVYNDEMGGGKYLHYTMDKGLFGYNVVKECYFSNSLEPSIIEDI